MEKLVACGACVCFSAGLAKVFQSEVLDQLIEMEFSSPWINGSTSGLELKPSVLDANITFA